MSLEQICFVLPSAYGYFNTDVDAVGGGARQLSLISRRLTDKFDVHFVVGDYGQPKKEVRDSVTLHRSYSPSPQTPRWKKPLQLQKLFMAMRRADADLYVYRGRPFQASITYVLSKILGVQWVYNLANDPNIQEQPAALPFPLRQLFNHAIQDADAVITQTESQAEHLYDAHGVPSIVVPSGYPPADEIIPLENREHFVWVGRLDPDQKRPHLFLDLAKQCPKVSFQLIGPPGQDSDYNNWIRTRANNLDNLTYIGGVEPEEIHTYYRDAIALINTSKYEGFPSTFLEAWRYKTPVLSLEVPPSRFSDKSADKGFANGEIESLVTLVRNLYEKPSRRNEIGKPAYDYFSQNLTIEKVAAQYGKALCQTYSG